MDVKLNEGELKAAIKDWLEKQMPDLLKDGSAGIGAIALGTYPSTATVTVEFVISAKEATAMPSPVDDGQK